MIFGNCLKLEYHPSRIITSLRTWCISSFSIIGQIIFHISEPVIMNCNYPWWWFQPNLANYIFVMINCYLLFHLLCPYLSNFLVLSRSKPEENKLIINFRIFVTAHQILLQVSLVIRSLVIRGRYVLLILDCE